MVKRPWREQLFQRIVQELPKGNTTVLELGSGPGFLGERVLKHNSEVRYIALDFSTAMHDLAKERLGRLADRVTFVVADFTQTGWYRELPSCDAVVSMQAVHELRHKRHAPGFYAMIRELLRPGGVFLMCDHFVGEGGMSDPDLYMTPEEQEAALEAGGFADPALLLKFDGLILFRLVK
jgi:cyclopropane fatty-acyl-phospholipid synthase-like methyltransferase